MDFLVPPKMESLEQLQTRHRKELKDLQGKITNKKKNSTKKTRKGINDECAELERLLRERHEAELVGLNGKHEEREDDSGHTEINGQDEDITTMNEITTQLQDANLSENTPPSSSIPGSNAQSQPKKRNRQKERLARRAAEQEEASAKAQEEAANMTDHRGGELEQMKVLIAANKRVQKDIVPDGHCLFNAVADQLQQANVPLTKDESTSDAPAYKTVRKAATDYMEAHPNDFAAFLEEPLDSYVRKIRDTAEWGGDVELNALANSYNVEIKVLADGRVVTTTPTSGSEEDRKTIWLAYYRRHFGLGEHYNSLRKQP